MIEVQNLNDDTEAIAKTVQEPEQRHRIGSARDAYADAITGVQKRLLFKRSEKLCAEVQLHVGIVSARGATGAKT